MYDLSVLFNNIDYEFIYEKKNNIQIVSFH